MHGVNSIPYSFGKILCKKKLINKFAEALGGDYIGGIEYVNDTLDAIYHSEGRIKYIDEVARYEYYIRDHLGNIRLTYSDLNADGLITTPDEIIEEMHYYAFGMMMEGSWMGSSGQYGYNGIEYESFLDLEMNLATFRGLDPTLGRWWQVDPKAEATMSLTPYGSMGNNPISFVDPEGDLFWAAVGIAAFANVAFQGTSGNINSFGDFIGAAAVGGLAGAAGYGAGSALGLGSVGFASGAATGAVGGSAGGFVGGAGNAWLGGASFGQGLGAGLKGAGFGAILGGFVGGVSGGINAVKHGGDFWNGKGSSFALEASATIPGEPVDYSNESARTFSDKYFGEVKEVNKLYADGSECLMCIDVASDMMTATHRDGRTIMGIAEYMGNGKTNVYLYKSLFSSPEQLYLGMGHEYMHAKLFAGGVGLSNSHIDKKYHHGVTYSWEAAQAKAWQLSGYSYYSRHASLLRNFTAQVPNYKNYWFPILKSRPW